MALIWLRLILVLEWLRVAALLGVGLFATLDAPRVMLVLAAARDLSCADGTRAGNDIGLARAWNVKADGDSRAVGQ